MTTITRIAALAGMIDTAGGANSLLASGGPTVLKSAALNGFTNNPGVPTLVTGECVPISFYFRDSTTGAIFDREDMLAIGPYTAGTGSSIGIALVRAQNGTNQQTWSEGVATWQHGWGPVDASLSSQTIRRAYALQGQSFAVLPENNQRGSVVLINNDPTANIWLGLGPSSVLPLTTYASAYPAGIPVASITIVPNASPTINPTAGAPCAIPAGTQYTMSNGDIVTVASAVSQGVTNVPINVTATIVNATSTSTTLTFVTNIGACLVAGQSVTVAGMTPSGYNGTWTVAAVTWGNGECVFTVTNGGNPGQGTVFGTTAYDPTPAAGGWGASSTMTPTNCIELAPGVSYAVTASPVQWSTEGTSYAAQAYQGVITAIADDCTNLMFDAENETAIPTNQPYPITSGPVGGVAGNDHWTAADYATYTAANLTARVWSYDKTGLTFADVLDVEPSDLPGQVTATYAAQWAALRQALGGAPIIYAFTSSPANATYGLAAVKSAISNGYSGVGPFYWDGTAAAWTTKTYATITAINAGTGVITANNNFSNGDIVALHSIYGITDADGLWYVVNASGTSFQVSSISGGSAATFSGTYTTSPLSGIATFVPTGVWTLLNVSNTIANQFAPYGSAGNPSGSYGYDISVNQSCELTITETSTSLSSPLLTNPSAILGSLNAINSLTVGGTAHKLIASALQGGQVLELVANNSAFDGFFVKMVGPSSTVFEVDFLGDVTASGTVTGNLLSSTSPGSGGSDAINFAQAITNGDLTAGAGPDYALTVGSIQGNSLGTVTGVTGSGEVVMSIGPTITGGLTVSANSTTTGIGITLESSSLTGGKLVNFSVTTGSGFDGFFAYMSNNGTEEFFVDFQGDVGLKGALKFLGTGQYEVVGSSTSAAVIGKVPASQSTTAQTGWLEVTINSTVYRIPVWTNL